MDDLEKKYLILVNVINGVIIICAFFSMIFYCSLFSNKISAGVNIDKEKHEKDNIKVIVVGILACIQTVIVSIITISVFNKKDTLGEDEFKKYKLYGLPP